MKKIRIFLLLFVATLAVACTGRLKSGAQQKPNIIFILIDDLGWMDLSCQGSRVYESPKIDKLAEESVSFTNAYAAHPRCVPSRYAIMTGNYPARGGVPAKRSELNENDKTFAAFLKKAGYTSCYIGKWHLGDGKESPVAKGFDYSIAAGKAGSPRNYFAPYNATYGKPWKERKAPIPNVESAPEGEYLNNRLTTEAIRFMKEHQNSPFFLMMAHYAVHEPLQAPENLVEKYNRKIAQTTFPDLPDYIPEGTGRTKMKQDNPIYAGMIENMDMNIGRLLQFLDDNKLSDNTIIIFTSDHGGLSNDGYKKRFLATSNYPLRAGKGWLYEGGTRVPLFIKWPGVTKPGITSEYMVTGIDFYPTIAEIVTEDPVTSDGQSLVPVLKGEKVKDRGAIFWYSPKARPKSTGDSNSIAVRVGNYKLIEWYETGRTELYNLKDDIGEQNDLSEEMTDKKDEMMNILRQWKKEMGIQ